MFAWIAVSENARLSGISPIMSPDEYFWGRDRLSHIIFLSMAVIVRTVPSAC